MQIPLQITWRNIPKSEALEADIVAKAEKLEEFFDHILSCRVVVEKSHGRHRKGNLYRLRLDIHVPDKEIVVTRDPGDDHAHEDMYVSIRDAFDAARRQLQDYVRVRRGHVKPHDQHHVGRVLRRIAAEDYGFLGTADGREIYFHRNSVVNADFDKLEPGTEVMFVEETMNEGVQAKMVSVGKHRFPEGS
ncbi:MAG TPA: HPF/RaiA family ribosome-associated protein [Pseudomonadales bacterium]